MSNSSCGAGYCSLEAISWKAAYGRSVLVSIKSQESTVVILVGNRLQEKDPATYSALRELSIEESGVQLQHWVDVKEAMEFDAFLHISS